MSILTLQKPPLVRANGKPIKRSTLKGKASAIATVGAVAADMMRQKAQGASPKIDGRKRARLMLVAKANIHITENVPVGNFTLVDPEMMQAAERAEAEAAGFTSRTLVVHPDDIDRAIEHFAAERAGEAETHTKN